MLKKKKSTCQPGHVPSEICRRILCLFPASGSFLAILGFPWFAAASFQSLPLSSHGVLFLCVCISVSLLLMTPVMLDLGLNLLQYDLILTWLITPAMTIFPESLHSKVLGVKTSTYLFKRYNSTYNTTNILVIPKFISLILIDPEQSLSCLLCISIWIPK